MLEDIKEIANAERGLCNGNVNGGTRKGLD
jgi:hypothetical protein